VPAIAASTQASRTATDRGIRRTMVLVRLQAWCTAYVTASLKRWSLTKRPARAEDGPAQVVVAGGSIAQLGQEQVDPGGELDRRRHLERLVLDPGAKAAPVNVDRELGDRTAVQVTAFGLADGDALDQVVEQLAGLLALDEGR